MTNHRTRVAFARPNAGVWRRRFEENLALGLLAAAFAVMLAQAAFAHGFKLGDIEIDHPWSRATPMGAKVAGGYFVLKNTGGTPDRLVSVAADIAGRTEIHEMAVNDGVMTMRPLADGITLPAKGDVALKPGGIHVMFMDLTRQLKQGERFEGTLTFEKAGAVKVQFAVEAMGATSGKPDPDHGDMHSTQ